MSDEILRDLHMGAITVPADVCAGMILVQARR